MKTWIQKQCLEERCPEKYGATIYPHNHEGGLVEVNILTNEELENIIQERMIIRSKNYLPKEEELEQNLQHEQTR